MSQIERHNNNARNEAFEKIGKQDADRSGTSCGRSFFAIHIPTTMSGPDRKNSPKMAESALSKVSQQYDFDGDGKLDEAEQALYVFMCYFSSFELHFHDPQHPRGASI